MIYLDHHATTPVDPRVLDAMLPWFCHKFGNPGSINHALGWEAGQAVEQARQTVAAALGASEREIVFTSGATESNNLALRGVCERAENGPRRHIVSFKTEHKAVLDPLARLARRGFEVTLLDVLPANSPQAGLMDMQQFTDALRPDTLLVSLMLANNEIGVIQPLAQVGAICRERGILLHCDATQAVGKLPINVELLQVDLLSLSAHKLYGPKGVGALYVRRRGPRVTLAPQIDGGGQEGGRRSGTLNTPGIIGLAAALQIAGDEREQEQARLAQLRARLWEQMSQLPGVHLNGPALDQPGLRLAGNLNVSFEDVDGEALMMGITQAAVSSGSACTTANPEPSHVLRALGLPDALVRASLRFGIGRFNTAEEIDVAAAHISEVVERLRAMR